MLAVGTFVGLFSTPCWSALCDVLQEKRLVLMLTTAGGAVSALLYLVPLASSALFVNGSAMIWTLLCRASYCFFFSPANGILDSIAVHSLENPKKDFGQCRLWGAASWGLVSALVLGPLLDCCVSGWIQPVGFACFALVMMAVTHTLLANAGNMTRDDESGQTMGDLSSLEDKDDVRCDVEISGVSPSCSPRGLESVCAGRDKAEGGGQGDAEAATELERRGRESHAQRADRLVEDIFLKKFAESPKQGKSAQHPAAADDDCAAPSAAERRARELVEANFSGFQDCTALLRSSQSGSGDNDGAGSERQSSDSEEAARASQAARDRLADRLPAHKREADCCKLEEESSQSGSGKGHEQGGGRDLEMGGRDRRGWGSAAASLADVLKRTCLIVWAERWLSLVFFLMLFVM